MEQFSYHLYKMRSTYSNSRRVFQNKIWRQNVDMSKLYYRRNKDVFFFCWPEMSMSMSVHVIVTSVWWWLCNEVEILQSHILVLFWLISWVFPRCLYFSEFVLFYTFLQVVWFSRFTNQWFAGTMFKSHKIYFIFKLHHIRDRINFSTFETSRMFQKLQEAVFNITPGNPSIHVFVPQHVPSPSRPISFVVFAWYAWQAGKVERNYEWRGLR